MKKVRKMIKHWSENIKDILILDKNQYKYMQYFCGKPYACMFEVILPYSKRIFYRLTYVFFREYFEVRYYKCKLDSNMNYWHDDKQLKPFETINI